MFDKQSIMKKKVTWFALYCMLAGMASCGDNGEAEAGKLLVKAEAALNAGQFNEAKIEIDSIRALYPKAFEARKAGIALMQRIDLKEQERSVAFLDSTLASLQAQAEERCKGFVFEKDTAYQDMGNYFHPTQTVEKNINRSFLRAQVNEKGKMTLTSIYCGPRNAHHTSVKVEAPDGTFAETPASDDIYESNDLGWKIEKADYPQRKDGGVMAFIALNAEQPLYVTFRGERTYKSRMPANDKTAIAELQKLAQLLSAIEQAKRDKEEALRKITFIKHKMQENQTEK